MLVEAICETKVRRLQEEDWAALEAMYDNFVPLGVAMGLPPAHPVRRRSWLASLSDGINLGAFVEDRVVAHLALLPIGDAAEMVAFVHQDFRRQGTGTALVQAAIQQARSANYKRISVFIDTANTAARQGLLKMGFRPVWEDLLEGEYVFPLGEP